MVDSSTNVEKQEEPSDDGRHTALKLNIIFVLAAVLYVIGGALIFYNIDDGSIHWLCDIEDGCVKWCHL